METLIDIEFSILNNLTPLWDVYLWVIVSSFVLAVVYLLRRG
jgi:hypothetical protein